jgi:cytidylate kinase
MKPGSRRRPVMAVLTISREFESGGREVGQAVAKLMNYEYIDRKTILEDMRRAGKQWEEQASHFDENYPNVAERYEWAFRGFVALNQYYMLDYATRDSVVIMGRGGNFLLRGIPYALRIMIKAPIELRIRKLINWEGMNSENARWLIEKADREMAQSVYLMHGRKWDDPGEYDMVFDTSGTTIDQIIPLVREGLLEKERRKSEQAKATLQLRTVAARVKAAIATEPTLSISILDVDPKEEGLPDYGIVVRGVVHNRDDVKRIETLARSIAGGVPVECQLQYRMYGRMGRPEFK